MPKARQMSPTGLRATRVPKRISMQFQLLGANSQQSCCQPWCITALSGREGLGSAGSESRPSPETHGGPEAQHWLAPPGTK
eukprot:9618158-Lingulodinium_polyedra.AAC.1